MILDFGVLVTTLVAAVLADAGYLYNAPNGVLHPHQPALEHNYQPHDVKILQNNQEEDKSISYSILDKDHIHLKNGNSNPHHYQLNSNYNNLAGYGSIRNFEGNGGISALQNIPKYGSDNGNIASAQPTAASDFNNRNAQSYVLPAVNVQSHIGYPHGSLHFNSNQNMGYTQINHLPGSETYSNSHVQTSPTKNSEYVRAFAAPVINNNYPMVFAPSANLNKVYAKNLIPIENNKLDNSYATGTYDNGNAQFLPSQSNVPLINGFSPTATSPRVVQNFGYPHNFFQSSSSHLGNGYIQSFSSPAISNPFTDYTQTSVTSTPTNLYSENGPSATSTSSVNLNTVYGVPSKALGANVDNAFVPNGSTEPLYVDLNSDLRESLSASTLDTSFTQTLTSQLTNGLVQNNLKTAISHSSVNEPNIPPVTLFIHKHIYFHAPPPEIEEPQKDIPPPPPAKKNYKIVFIKLPSQESKSNLAYLQQQVQTQNRAVEHKTLIYVLVKNPEDPKPVVLSKHKPSDHQVFFVRYNDSPLDIASQVNDELDKTGSVKNIVPLKSGLVNGQFT